MVLVTLSVLQYVTEHQFYLKGKEKVHWVHYINFKNIEVIYVSCSND